MIYFSRFLMILSASLFTSQAYASQETQAVEAPFGEYRVVAQRSAYDVAHQKNSNSTEQWLGQSVQFGEGYMNWIEGKTCDLWSVVERKSPAVTLDDPNLSDLSIPSIGDETSLDDKRVNMSVDLVCHDNEKQILGNFVIIDHRVLVVPVLNGAFNLILEKPLTANQVQTFQKQLKDMKFYDGEINGEMDEATISGVGFYAEYRGAQYRFKRTAITENILDGLGVLPNKSNPDKFLFKDYQPKYGADRLQDFRPEYSRKINTLPTVTIGNLDNMINLLDSMKLRASKLPGKYVSGNLPLGANNKEYIPSEPQIMAAALGDRIKILIEASPPDLMADIWPKDRERSLRYDRFEIRHADVMGSGRFYYSSKPLPVHMIIKGSG